MQIVTVLVVLVAFGVWAFAVGSWIMALANRKPEVPLSSLLMSGMKAFDSDNFTEAGQKHQRRFTIAFGIFFLVGFVGAAFVIVASSTA